MRKIKLILSIMIITSVSPGLNAQNAEIDSLINLLGTHPKEDTVRVNLLNKIAYSLGRNDPEKSLSYVEEALELADKLNYQKGISESLDKMGFY